LGDDLIIVSGLEVIHDFPRMCTSRSQYAVQSKTGGVELGL